MIKVYLIGGVIMLDNCSSEKTDSKTKTNVEVINGMFAGKKGYFFDIEQSNVCEVNIHEAVDCNCNGVAKVFLEDSEEYVNIPESELRILN
jgi:hypothetical protein